MKSKLSLMENGFYFALRAYLVLKIFKFLSWIIDHVDWLQILFSKFVLFLDLYCFQNFWRHNLVNKQLQYILFNISRSKDNQAMKLGQLT